MRSQGSEPGRSALPPTAAGCRRKERVGVCRRGPGVGSYPGDLDTVLEVIGDGVRGQTQVRSIGS